MSDRPYPRAFSHVGITVTDLDRAVEWYRSVLGCTLLMGPLEIDAGDTPIGRLCTDIFGDRFQKMRLAHMSTGNYIGLELFEFKQPKSERRADNFEYWKNGFFHICVTDPNIEALSQRIAESGGKHRSQIWELFPGSGYRMTYCEDPFGNIIEIYTHGYEQTYSNRSGY